MDALSQSLTRSPELFPHALDLQSETVRFIRLDEAGYRSASFLDDRILSVQTPRRVDPWAEIEHVVAENDLQESCHFIFHIGHVGSTLLSRLLGQQGGVFALREPAILRTMAQIRGEPSFELSTWDSNGFERRLSTLLKLWSRTFRETDTSIVKATSFVSELAAELLSRAYNPLAILMFVSAESYLATILGGANAPQEARALAPARLKRLQRRLGSEISDLSALSIGEIVAMSWACEMTALARARDAAPERALLLDFDRLISDPASALSRALRHLAVPFQSQDILAITRSPDMGRYSKAPEFAYDAQLRRDVLNQARAISGDEIKRGLIWLDGLAQKHPAVAAAMTLSA